MCVWEVQKLLIRCAFGKRVLHFPNACLRFSRPFFILFYFIFFFIFFSALMNSNKYCSCTVRETNFTVYVLFTYCLWDPKLLYSEKNIKNGFHDTIYIFKNYFATVFFNFQFSAVSKQTLSVVNSGSSTTKNDC